MGVVICPNLHRNSEGGWGLGTKKGLKRASKPLKTVRNCISANPKFIFFWGKGGPQIYARFPAKLERTAPVKGYPVSPVYSVSPAHFQTPGSVTGSFERQKRQQDSNSRICAMVLRRLCFKYIAESNDERILKISQPLPKLWTNWMLFNSQCSSV